MPGSQTTPSSAGTRSIAPADFAFRQVNNVGTRIYNGFTAQWLACTLPYRRFAVVLAGDHARIGADVGCYSFIAVDFHHILLAGFSRRSHSRYGLHTRAATNSWHAFRRLQLFRHLHSCSGCFRLERSPGGIFTHRKAPPLHGAHPIRSLSCCVPRDRAPRADFEADNHSVRD